MENIRGARLRKFNLRKIILGVRMHFRHIDSVGNSSVVTAREIHSIVSHRCTITIIMVPKFWGFCLESHQFLSTYSNCFDDVLPKSKLCTSLKLLATMSAEVDVPIFSGCSP